MATHSGEQFHEMVARVHTKRAQSTNGLTRSTDVSPATSQPLTPARDSSEGSPMAFQKKSPIGGDFSASLPSSSSASGGVGSAASSPPPFAKKPKGKPFGKVAPVQKSLMKGGRSFSGGGRY